MRAVQFAFGKSGITAPLPDCFEYMMVENRSAQPLSDIQAALNHALDYPVAGPSLRQLATGKKTAAISLCDITRPVPNSITLPPLLKRLHEAGIQIEGVSILIATGLHRAATDAEIRVIVGADIASRYRVLNHDATQITEHRWLGSTASGTPVYVDERFIQADLHITLGFIEQHLMLGFSGGRKLIAPGVAGQETIKVIHSPRFMREPNATEGHTTDNPLHAELLEIAHMARHDFMLDVTLNRERKISGVFAGEPVSAHAAGVQFLKDTSIEVVPFAADLVITSAAGYPLDLTFYQTIKGITAAQHCQTRRQNSRHRRVLRRNWFVRVRTQTARLHWPPRLFRRDSRLQGRDGSMAIGEACACRIEARTLLLHSRGKQTAGLFFGGTFIFRPDRGNRRRDYRIARRCAHCRNSRRALCVCASRGPLRKRIFEHAKGELRPESIDRG
jgi:hypothetical protein